MKNTWVILCRSCHGNGTRRWIENIPGHNLEQREHSMKCTTCNGTGRLWHTETATDEPFDPEKYKDGR
jgi:DnaJ-class molecular chaperone